jgi:MPBQ/MSBQ methyltransferase
MASDELRDRIADQFSYRGARSDIWRVFDIVLDTDAFLNLGYSRWYQPHFVGSSQRRLATHVGRRLGEHLPRTDGCRVLDIGCGRGGPTIHLADRFGFEAIGLDLVPYNVSQARSNAADRSAEVAFAVGDATRLPFESESLAACVGVDSLVYLPDRYAVFSEVADVLEPGGVFVFSDLVVRGEASEGEREAVSQFADAWDMPELGSPPKYEHELVEAGLGVREVADLSPHSVDRFRKWTTLFGWLSASPGGYLVDRALRQRGLDATTITGQIRSAHAALPALRHALFVAAK